MFAYALICDSIIRRSHGKKAFPENPREAIILKEKYVWQHWNGPDEYEDAEHLLCSNCAALWKEDDDNRLRKETSRRAYNKRKADERQEEKKKRVAATVAGSDFLRKLLVLTLLLKLKTPQLI